MPATVLWDNDGVLVDTEQQFFEVNRELLAECGFALSREQFIAWFMNDSRGAWHLLRASGYSESDIDRLRHMRNQRHQQRLAERTDLAAEGIEDVLRAIAPRAIMGLVTSSSRTQLEITHRHTSLLQYFHTIVTEDDCPQLKPDPAPYLLAMRRLGVSPSHCIAVEDSARGMRSAVAAGLRCIIRRGPLTDHKSITGHCMVDTADQLRAALECWVETHG